MSTLQPHRSRWRRWLVSPLALLAALVLLFEEWGWQPIARAMAALGRLPAVRALETRIAALPPWGAATAFVVPALLLLPFKLAAVWLIARGALLPGLLTIISAKLVGTAVAARLYALCAPALLSLGWFAWAHDKLLRFHRFVHDWLQRQPLWQATHALLRKLRRLREGFFSRVWRRLLRRQSGR